MIKARMKIIAVFLAASLVICLSACDDSQPVKPKAKPAVVQKKIISPAPKPVNKTPKKVVQAQKAMDKVGSETKNGTDKSDKLSVAVQTRPDMKQISAAVANTVEKTVHYNFKGKIDPFKPLIQEKTEENTAVKDKRPKRILTPLEKFDLSQIRLVAVILMKNKKIAMVEEATGKGYEVGIGTYIGRNQGRVSEIKSSSIVVRELVKDFAGRLKEKEHEIKLNRLDGE